MTTTYIFKIPFIFSIYLLFNSCLSSFSNDTECTSSNCLEGECIENICTCFIGFEGENCDIPVNEKFIGTWNMTYICSEIGEENENGNNTLEIKEAQNNPSKITFNLHTLSLIADVENSQFIIIPQKVGLGGGFNIEVYGSGSINDKVLTITTYQSVITGVPYTTCHLTGEK